MFQLHAYKDHGRLEEEDLKVDVLCKELKTQMRKIIEAKMIRMHKPTLKVNKGRK